MLFGLLASIVAFIVDLFTLAFNLLYLFDAEEVTEFFLLGTTLYLETPRLAGFLFNESLLSFSRSALSFFWLISLDAALNILFYEDILVVGFLDNTLATL